MCIYETLFHAKSTAEITHQIAERIAIYTSKNRPTRNSIYEKINETYNVRSIYFHGNSFKSYKKDLEEVSKYLDYLSRQILTKIVSRDATIFLQDGELLEASFLDLIFEDQRAPDSLIFESGIPHLRFNDDSRSK